MYSEGLAPHPLRSDNEKIPLEERLRLDNMRQSLENTALHDPQAYESLKLRYVDLIAKEVGRSLWYPQTINKDHKDDFESYGLPNPLPLSTIQENQFTNCHGYTLVGSECLEKAGIEHWIAFANRHAFMLVPTTLNGARTVYFTDMLSPYLNQVVSEAINPRNFDKLPTGIRRTGRTAAILNTYFLAPVGTDTDALSQMHTWMKSGSHNAFSPRYTSVGMPHHEEYKELMSQYSHIMSVYSMEKGRVSLEHYVDLRCAIATNNIEDAYQILIDMHGIYPELNARQSHDEIKRIALYLAHQNRSDEAIRLVEDHFDSNFSFSTDSRFLSAKGDILRAIARKTNHLDAANMAISCYVEANKSPHAFHATLLGKIATAKVIRDEIEAP